MKIRKNPNIKRIRSGKEEQIKSALSLRFIMLEKMMHGLMVQYCVKKLKNLQKKWV